MHRLKFQYLEHNAKDKYVKTIVNDDAPMITADSNTALQAANLVKKDNLKAAKSMLAQKHADIRNLAPHVERGKVPITTVSLRHLTKSVQIISRLRGWRLKLLDYNKAFWTPNSPSHACARLTPPLA
jgi:hypothetical protein